MRALKNLRPLLGSFIFILPFSSPLFSGQERPRLAMTCLGPEDGAHRGIFLHGIDSAEPSPYFKNLLQGWKNLAQRQRLRLALPRAPFNCSSPQAQGKMCWNWNAPAQAVGRTWEDILSSAASCFKKPIHMGESFVLIGHSNGGYFVNRLLELCLENLPKHMISIASSGRPPNAADNALSTCGHLSLYVGAADPTLAKTLSYYQSLQRARADVSFARYQGGHDIVFPELEVWLNSLFNTRK